MQAHIFQPSVLREYDIRGIIDNTLNTSDAEALGRAYGTTIKRAGGSRVCVGRDGRLSSPEMSAALVQGILSTGIDVLNVGLGPTPLLYYSVFELDSDGGVMVTGSHNPPNYNGFKMMLGKKPCFGEAIQDLGKLASAGDFESGSGKEEIINLSEKYTARLLRDFSGKAHKIVWDPANGAAGDIISRLVKNLPGEHVVINAEIDGTFPNHHADPTVEENLQQLKDKVLEIGADMGFSFDGDGDRIGAIDAKARVIWGDQLLAIMAGDLLKELPGAPIIADVKASQAFFDRVAELGGKPVMWKTGHSLIKAKMTELQAPLAGEMSGHIFYKHKFYGHDDAIYAGLRLINAVDSQGGDIAALRDSLPQTINTPELRFDCADERKFDAIAEIAGKLTQDGADMSTVDGVRVNTPDGWWLLRASNTQAVLVARCEASTDEGLERLKSAVREALAGAGIAAPADL